MTDNKIVKISKQRQITIPKAFFEELQLQEEVTIERVEGGLLINPVRKMPDDFAEQLLESLVSKGFSGQELLEKFKEASKTMGWTIFKSEGKDDTK